MPGIDTSRDFIPLNIAVLTVSDTRTQETDISGDLLTERIEKAGHKVIARHIVPDDVVHIRRMLKQWIAELSVDVIVATGGAGLTGRDVTPEAFKSVYDKEIDGFSIIFHLLRHQKVGVATMQWRVTAGIADDTYLFALPGDADACADAWDDILAFQLDNRNRPTNFVEIRPRLAENRQK